MRIPHYLTRSPSGRYTFRLLVPRHLRDTLGRKVIKRSLHTCDLYTAQFSALALFERYARIFNGGLCMSKTLEELLASGTKALKKGGSEWVLERDGQGNITKAGADSPEDHARFMEAMNAVNAMQYAPVSTVKPPDEANRLTLGKACELWLASIKPSTAPKTYTIKKSAIDNLEAFIGTKTQLHTITRPDLARWYQSLKDAELAPPTLVNKQSYVGGKEGFFTWAIASGYYTDVNPASGHVRYTTRDKRIRKKFGFKAFTPEQVQALFAPAVFSELSYHARWASIIGLYTGARASEVGQLLVIDVTKVFGIDCITFTDEGENQKLKSVVSLRTVPIHADVLSLGFLDYVNSLTGKRVFPNGKAVTVNGAGNWITKAFSPYIATVGKDWEPAKRGFHSLRKTVIQTMQTAGVHSEMRAQIVGHELDDEHHATYSREFNTKEKLKGLKLNYGLELDALRPLLAISASKRPT